MRIPAFFRTRGDTAVIGPRLRDCRLESGRMTLAASGLRFRFGTRPQTAPATVVLIGDVPPISIRLLAGQPAKIRLFLLPTPSSRYDVTLFAADGAAGFIEFYVLAAGVPTTLVRSTQVGVRASLELATVLASGARMHVVDRAVLAGEGASLRADTLAVAGGDDRLEVVQHVEHRARETQSVLHNALVAADAASIVFDVTGAIAKGYAGSDCQQRNKGILLGETASIEVAPKLLIEEFDVAAGHGCAIGRISPDELFYLTSRGLDERMAKRLVIAGTTAPYLEKLTSPADRRLVEKAIAQRLGGGS